MKSALYRRGGKRMLDVTIGTIALVLSAPVQLLAAAAIRSTMGSPVLFRQRRPGLGGEPFTLLKFRTMTDPCRADGAPRPDSERVTPVGQFLRMTSIDELPELWNVVRGDMSLVGPRPLLMEYLPLYDARQFARHYVRPGLTGLAQISGRNATTWGARLRMDTQYVDEYSLWGDLSILARTIKVVVTRRGIYSPTLGAFAPQGEEDGRDVV